MSGRRWRQIDLGVWKEVEADGPWCVEGGGGRCLGGGGGRLTLVCGRRWRQIDLGVWKEVEAGVWEEVKAGAIVSDYASVASPNLTVFFCFLDVLTQLIVIKQVVFVLQLCNVQTVVIIPLFHYCLL